MTFSIFSKFEKNEWFTDCQLMFHKRNLYAGVIIPAP